MSDNKTSNSTFNYPTPFTPTHLLAAWRWLCRSRRHYPPNADIWHLRFHRQTEIPALLQALHLGEYRLSPLQIIAKFDGTRQAIWSAKDALVLKIVTLVLETRLPVHPACEHIKGHGGGQQSVRRLDMVLQTGETPFVCRTDIQGYYQHINKSRLLRQLEPFLDHAGLFNVVTQFVHYSVEDGGIFHTPTSGISRGSALSPLLAAFHLYALDLVCSTIPKVKYVRYMDDFLFFTRSRWQLRRNGTGNSHSNLFSSG